MKKVLTILTLVGLIVGFTAGEALAYSFSFSFHGDFTLSDTDNDDFKDQLQLGDGYIQTAYTPSSDGIFDDVGSGPAYWERVEFDAFSLDPSSFVSGVSYDFAPTTYVGGFRVYDDIMAGGALLFSADITVTSLVANGGTAAINPAFNINLSNVTKGASYVVGTSEIVDAFLNPSYPAATDISLQIAASNLASIIESTGSHTSTYSGSAAVVPEPGTVLLLGVGLIGLIGLGRKFKK